MLGRPQRRRELLLHRRHQPVRRGSGLQRLPERSDRSGRVLLHARGTPARSRVHDGERLRRGRCKRVRVHNPAGLHGHGINDQVCCHEGVLPLSEVDPLNMERPRCSRTCSPSVGQRYAASSDCDEPGDCANPSQTRSDDPFECCMVGQSDGPSHRECRLRSECRTYACRTDAACARIHHEYRCGLERSGSGNNIARPEVRTCQSP